jgi:hypothetical protein
MSNGPVDRAQGIRVSDWVVAFVHFTQKSRLNYSGTANVVQGAVPNWDKGGPSTHAKAPPEMRGDPDAPAQGLAAPGSVVLTARTSGTSGPTWEPGISTAPPQPRQALNPCQGRGFHGHGQTSSALAEPSAGVPHNHALSQRAILLGILMRANPLQLEGRSAHREVVVICAASKMCPTVHLGSASGPTYCLSHDSKVFSPTFPSKSPVELWPATKRVSAFPFTIPQPRSFLHSP